ncbi:hypothetical protein [Tsukamurella sp. 1534]|uniref:SecDF P1 head subdomain-containing protein n=1 Tax=Tsukamurella sp. 1534 TaxID=1151061 RepID=UPI0002E9CF64|nr:hypothetical protein [Tsukamurella sp. 1534]
MKRGLRAAAAVTVGLGMIAGGGTAGAAPKDTLELRKATLVAGPPSAPPCTIVPQHPAPGDRYRACGPDGRSVFDLSAAYVATTPRDAKAVRTPSGSWVVEVTLAPGASEAVRRATARLRGSQMAMVHEGRVISAPLVQEPVDGPRLQIGGSFDQKAAVQLATELKG